MPSNSWTAPFLTCINNTRQEILNTLAQVEVNIDYPEYDDVEEATTEIIREKTTEFEALLTNLLKTARRGKILREGISTAIIGRPNVGKSSLLNNLLREEKAIVTDIEGTTRDVIEEYVNINGVPLKLVDTAGIRETEDIVEQIGVERSKKALKEADLVLLVLNASEPLTDQDRQLLEISQDSNRIILLNKVDLPQQDRDWINSLQITSRFLSLKIKILIKLKTASTPSSLKMQVWSSKMRLISLMPVTSL